MACRISEVPHTPEVSICLALSLSQPPGTGASLSHGLNKGKSHIPVTSAALQPRDCLKLARGRRSVAFPGALKDPAIFLGQWKELSVFVMDDHGEVGWPWLRKWAWSSSFRPGC